MEDSAKLAEDSLIYITYQGDQNYELVSQLNKDIEKITKELRTQNKSVCLFIDVTKLGKTNADARKIGLTIMKTADFDKAALVGQNIFTKYLVMFMIAAAQKEATVKYFTSGEEAKKWLTENSIV